MKILNYDVEFVPQLELSGVADSEKKRLNATVFADNRHQKLEYSLKDEGKVVVKVGRGGDNGGPCEHVICIPENMEYSKDSTPVLVITKNGTERHTVNNFEYMSLPEGMKKVVDGYINPELRKNLGIDDAHKKARKKLTVSKKGDLGL